jgi:hypothetical protein
LYEYTSYIYNIKLRDMQIVRLINDTWQLIDESTNSVLFQGSFEDCQLVMWGEEENRMYRDFLLMSGI